MTRTLPPQLTHVQRSARRDEKRAAILAFLASGEVYTVAEIAAQVLGCSRPTAWRTLAALESDAAIKSEEHMYRGNKIRLWGLTPHGAALAGRFEAPVFELGRTNPSWIEHRLDTQRMRIAAEKSGWTQWVPERALQGRGLKKVPDAAAIDTRGHLVAIEIERHCKTQKRYAEIILAYLQEIKANRFARVAFVCPDGVESLVQRAFSRVEAVKFQGEIVTLTEAHRSRFSFAGFSNWPERNHG